MTGPPILELRNTLMPEDDTDQVVRALRLSVVVHSLVANYEELLERMVFPNPRAEADRKDVLQSRRCLLADESHEVLTIIWKESAYITPSAVSAAGFKRDFPEGSLTAYRLAVRLAGTGPDAADRVSALNSRIRAIGRAAHTFGLVERTQVTRTKVLLKGTSLLHEFMTALSVNNALVLNEVIPLITPAKPTFGWADNLDGERHDAN